MSAGRRCPLIQNTKSGEILEVRESKCYVGRDDADSPVTIYLSSLGRPNITHCELRAGLGVLVLLPLDFCLVDSKEVSTNHPVILAVDSRFQISNTEFKVVQLPRRIQRQLPKVPVASSPASRNQSSMPVYLLEAEYEEAVKFASLSSLFFYSNYKGPWTQSTVVLTDNDSLVEQTADFMCHQLFCQPLHSDFDSHLLESVSKELESLMSKYSNELIIWLEKFVHEYEECHNQKPTDCNPRPGDKVVCILLCGLVKLCQKVEELVSVSLWLRMLVVFAKNSSCICLLLIWTKFPPTLMALVCMSTIGVTTSETGQISCSLLGLLVGTLLPRGHKLPIGEGFMHVVIHSLEQIVCYSSPNRVLVLALCRLLVCVVTAATTWWLDVSTTGPTMLAYLQRVAVPVLQKVADCFTDYEDVLVCVRKVKDKLAERKDLWRLHSHLSSKQSGKVAMFDSSDVISQRNAPIPGSAIVSEDCRTKVFVAAETGDVTGEESEGKASIEEAAAAAYNDDTLADKTVQKTLIPESDDKAEAQMKDSVERGRTVGTNTDTETLIPNIAVQTRDATNERTSLIHKPTLLTDNNESITSASAIDVQRRNAKDPKSTVLESAGTNMNEEREQLLCSYQSDDLRDNSKEHSLDSPLSSLKAVEQCETLETCFKKQPQNVDGGGSTMSRDNTESMEVYETKSIFQNSLKPLDHVVTDGLHVELTSSATSQSPSTRKGWKVASSDVCIYGLHDVGSTADTTDKVEDAIDELHSHHSSLLTSLKERAQILKEVAFEVNKQSYQSVMSFLVVNKVDEITLLDVLGTLLFNGVQKAQWDSSAIKEAVTILTPIIAGHESRLVIRACEVVQALVGVYSKLQLNFPKPGRSTGKFKGHVQEQYEECQRSFLYLRKTIADDSSGLALANLSPGHIQDDYVLARHALLLHLSST